MTFTLFFVSLTCASNRQGRMELTFLLSGLAVLITSAECVCSPTTLHASPASASKRVQSLQNEHCTIYIAPVSGYSSNSYYLDISWSSWNFDIQGNMPLCVENYLEVFLTRSNNSIGKFCSSNADSPWRVYSKDGSAKLSYFSSGYSPVIFEFSYQLISKTRSSSVGGYPTNTGCDKTRMYPYRGLLSSPGWPLGYSSFPSPCEFIIKREFGYHGFYFFFMDIDFSPYGYPGDCVQLYGSNVSHSYVAISSKFCGTYSTQTYVTYSQNLNVTYNRPNGGSSSYRGFLAGYIAFKTAVPITKPPTTTAWTPPESVSTSSNSNARVIVLCVTIPLVVIIILGIGIIVVVCTKRHQGQNGESYHKLDNVSSVHNPSHEFSQSKCMHPTAFMQSGSRFIFSYPIGYNHVPSHSMVEKDVSENAPAQSSGTAAPANGFMPVGALLSQSQQGIEGQQPSTVTANLNDAKSLVVLPVGVSPNAVSQPQCKHTTSTMQIGSHLADPRPIGYTAVPSHSDDKQASSGNQLSQSSCIVAATNVCMPVGALQPLHEQGITKQEPSGNCADNPVIPPVRVRVGLKFW